MLHGGNEWTSMPETPAGVRIRSLQANKDERGAFLEIFRAEWDTACEPIQWNVINSEAGVLRGVHVHATHTDYLIVVSGVMLLGLHDLRPAARNGATSCMLTLDAKQPMALTIPPGVCHGFFHLAPTIHVYAVNEYWNPSGELGCRFDAPELDLDWPNTAPLLSERDRTAPSYSRMKNDFLARWRTGDLDAGATNETPRP
jgi:dTDP-4-dehydrorhamnose 3,5-epimerase